MIFIDVDVAVAGCLPPARFFIRAILASHDTCCLITPPSLPSFRLLAMQDASYVAAYFFRYAIFIDAPLMPP